MSAPNHGRSRAAREKKHADIVEHLSAIVTVVPFLIAHSFLDTFETVTIPITAEIWMPLALMGVVKPLNRRQLEHDGVPADLQVSAAGPVTGYIFTTTTGRRGIFALGQLARNPCRVTMHYQWAEERKGSISSNLRAPADSSSLIHPCWL